MLIWESTTTEGAKRFFDNNIKELGKVKSLTHEQKKKNRKN